MGRWTVLRGGSSETHASIPVTKAIIWLDQDKLLARSTADGRHRLRLVKVCNKYNVMISLIRISSMPDHIYGSSFLSKIRLLRTYLWQWTNISCKWRSPDKRFTHLTRIRPYHISKTLGNTILSWRFAHIKIRLSSCASLLFRDSLQYILFRFHGNKFDSGLTGRSCVWIALHQWRYPK